MNKDIYWFKEQVKIRQYILTSHARQESIDEDISIEDIENAVLNGEIIEDYSSRNDIRGKSCLITGPKLDLLPVHVVASCSFEKMYVVTVYLPKPPKWLNERIRRYDEKYV